MLVTWFGLRLVWYPFLTYSCLEYYADPLRFPAHISHVVQAGFAVMAATGRAWRRESGCEGQGKTDATAPFRASLRF